MKNSRNRTKLTATIVLVLLMASVMFIAVSVNPVQAQLSSTQPYSGALKSGDVATGTMSTTAQISARPNLVGVGQPVMFNLWITPASLSNRRLLDYKVTITKPDGTKDEWTINSEIDTAATWFEYVVDQVGEYTYKFDFPGTYLPAGRYLNGVIVTNTSGTLYTGSTYYKPSSSPVSTFTVQTEIVASWPPTALPSDYWTRPVAPELREWVPILGDYPWYGPGTLDWSTRYPNCSAYWNPQMDFFPYVQGPNSAHIVWKRVEGSAGITGAGRYTEYGTRGWVYEAPSSTASSSAGTMPMVIAGRGYMVVTRVKPQMVGGTIQNIPTSVWQCIDIRTGEVLWERDWIGLSQSQQSFGGWVFRGAIEYPSLSIVYISGDRLYKFDRNTGAMTLNASIAPLYAGVSMYGEFAGVVQYMNGFALGVQNIGNATVPNYRLINFTTTGTSSTLASRIVSNISWPISSVPITTDHTEGIAVLGPDNGWIDTSGTTPEQRIITVSLTTGQVLVNKTIAPAGSDEYMGYSVCTSIADHGILAFLTNKGYFVGFDIRTGEIAWRSPKMDYPWDVNGFGAYDITSAYGMFYRCAYSGVYAFDWKTGKIVWKYKAPAISPFEAPYIDETGATVYSFNGVAIAADGKIYTYNTEHTPTQPITRGWQLHAIDAFTGEEVFKVMLSGSVDFVADGYLGVSESYTGTYYVLGRGKSQTTVTAPDTAVPLGTAVVIKGTIVDMSPAQPGTPCVSKDSMATQMEYLHKQMPLSGLWGNETITGVPVTLTAIGSDGTVIDIGTTTTNGYYGTFSKAWTPPKEDTYTIMATFAGDDSYGSSSAATGLSVGPAPASPTPTPTPQPQAAPDNTPTIIGMGIAIIIAVAIATILLLRKRT